jgi:hypothetical protein
MWVCPDFVVERRGFELMAIAVSRPRIAGFRQRISKAMRGGPEALTMICHLPVSLRFHSLSS